MSRGNRSDTVASGRARSLYVGAICEIIFGMNKKHPLTPHGNYRRLAGMKFGRLTAIRPSGIAADGHILWECRCSCKDKTIVHVKSHNLTKANGGTRSCGCLRREIASKRKRIAWNKGRTYAIAAPDGSERVYTQKHSWSNAVLRAKGSKCERCGWNRATCDVHHAVPRSRGGKNTISNGMVLCPNCHRELHEKELRDEAPVPVQRH